MTRLAKHDRGRQLRIRNIGARNNRKDGDEQCDGFHNLVLFECLSPVLVGLSEIIIIFFVTKVNITPSTKTYKHLQYMHDYNL